MNPEKAPPAKYRVRIELYVADNPNFVLLRDDGPAASVEDIRRATESVAQWWQRATQNYEANQLP